MDYLIRHKTCYRYQSEAVESQNLACLVPGNFPGQELTHFSLTVDPEPGWTASWVDVFGNRREAFSLATGHDSLEVELLATVRVHREAPGCPLLPWEEAVLPDGSAWRSADPLKREYVCSSPLLPALQEAGGAFDDCFTPGRPVRDALTAFMEKVYREFQYDPKATDTFTPLQEVLDKRAGVCQDFAHAAIAELRRRGFAAGYVSGYLETVPPPGQSKLRGADATHAWYAVYVPGGGWLHFDPTNNVIPGDRHVVTAWGRDYADVAPVKGVVLGGGEHRVDVQVDVWRSPDQVPEEFSQRIMDLG